MNAENMVLYIAVKIENYSTSAVYVGIIERGPNIQQDRKLNSITENIINLVANSTRTKKFRSWLSTRKQVNPRQK